MKKGMVAVLALLVALTVSSEVFAQGMKGKMGGWGANSQYQRIYNPATVETVRGAVVSIGTFTPMKGAGNGVHLALKTDKGTIPVHLGPAWFIDNQEIKIKKGDKIKVTGSRVSFNGKPAIIAQTVEMGNEMLKLRDENGFPMWAGWRRMSK